MSDQNPGGADFRATDKRKDETVMVNADDLSNLVADARQVPPANPAPAPVAPAAPAASAPNRTMLLVLVAVAVLVAIGLVAFLVL